MNDAEFLLIAGAGLALLSALCFFFPGFSNFWFWFPSAGQDRGIAYVFGFFSVIVLLIGLGRLVGLLHWN